MTCNYFVKSSKLKPLELRRQQRSESQKLLKQAVSTGEERRNLIRRNSREKAEKQTRLHVNVSLYKGIGVSLVNSNPEELLYASLCGVNMNLTLGRDEQSVLLRIQKVQVDLMFERIVKMLMTHFLSSFYVFSFC